MVVRLELEGGARDPGGRVLAPHLRGGAGGGGGRRPRHAELQCEERGEPGTPRRQSAPRMDSSVRPLAMARRWNQRPPPPVLLLLLLLLLPPPLPLLLEAGDPLPTKGQLMNSCIQARKKCQADYSCNATYRYLKSCSSNISTSSPAEEPSVSEDCLEAVQHLQNTSLMSCTCHRRMKNQTACLDIYWTVHPARTLDDYELNISPYEDTVTRKLWKMNPRKLKQLKPDLAWQIFRPTAVP